MGGGAGGYPGTSPSIHLYGYGPHASSHRSNDNSIDTPDGGDNARLNHDSALVGGQQGYGNNNEQRKPSGMTPLMLASMPTLALPSFAAGHKLSHHHHQILQVVSSDSHTDNAASATTATIATAAADSHHNRGGTAAAGTMNSIQQYAMATLGPPSSGVVGGAGGVAAGTAGEQQSKKWARWVKKAPYFYYLYNSSYRL